MPMLACRFADWSLAGHQRGSVWPSPVATPTTLPFQGPLLACTAIWCTALVGMVKPCGLLHTAASMRIGRGSSGPNRVASAMIHAKATGTVVLCGRPMSSLARYDASAAATPADRSAAPLGTPKSCPSESATQVLRSSSAKWLPANPLRGVPEAPGPKMDSYACGSSRPSILVSLLDPWLH
eukprot:3191112-Heterocapsa_arctica.AAC.1